ncbi:hypothetical protein Ocin01_18729 [Orchesella cincta]|uniref:Uncharacterized protein n=1 Tax=Orchesella cincta TaxID=48709 RepID=A0A1D2M4R1_ORCCI|nr:hypothetical protein Ocin01_18729 [Orchesella cincta]
MARVSFYSSLLFCLGVISFSAAQEILTECGQTLHANEGRIDWVLESHGINEADPKAIFIASLDFGSVNMIYDLGPPESIATLKSSGYGAVVVFRTKTNLGTGFSLSFTAEKSKEGELLGTDFVFNNATENTTSSLALPVSTFRKMPHSTVIVVTAGAKRLPDPQFSLRVNLTQEFGNAPGFCWSFIRPYLLGDDGLAIGSTFCSGEPVTYRSQTLEIMLFYTDALIDLAKGTVSWYVGDNASP